MIGAVAMVKGKFRGHTEILSEVRDELEPLLQADFFAGAPFTWIGLVLRYGLRNGDEPDFGRVTSHGDLPVGIEIDASELRSLSRVDVKKAIRRATLLALAEVAKQFERPGWRIDQALAELKLDAQPPAN